MTEYIIAIVVPFKNKVTYSIVKTEKEVWDYLNKRRNNYYDYVIIKKEVDNEGVESFTLQKSGYARIYSIVNKIFVLFGIILLLLFSYLYYKFLKL